MTSAPPPPVVTASKPSKYKVTSGPTTRAQRVGIYGVGGVGKTELASLAPNPIFIDLENGSNRLNVARITGVKTFADLMELLSGNDLDSYGSVVLDSMTAVQDLVVAHILATIKKEKGGDAKSIEDYGYGKGYTYIYDHMQLVLGALERRVDRGQHVICILHTVPAKTANPDGENYINHQPALMSSEGNVRANVRSRFVGWVDHLLFVNYDRSVDEGKAKSGGTRAIYTQERGGYLAKSRTKIDNAIPYRQGDGKVWELLGLK